MTAAEIFAVYRGERAALSLEGFTLEVLPHLARYTARLPGADGLVAFAMLPSGGEATVIEEQIAYFDALLQPFEWKVYEFDQPATLRGVLERHGFTVSEPEAFLVLAPERWTWRDTQPAGVEIRRVTDDIGLRDVVTLQEEVAARNFDWLFQRYSQILRTAPGQMAMFCAYVENRPVGTGWIDFPEGSRFAELHGGAVATSQRGRGIFTALLDHRMREAQHRGFRFVAVDAAPMSRPILLSKGFEHICWTFPMHRTS